jgi:glycosyltransferase involved in cell wall biosynthesis
MRILYDGEIFSMQRAGGVNRYFANLIKRLPASFRPTLLTAHDCGLQRPAHPRLEIYCRRNLDLRRVSHRLDHYRTRLKSYYLRRIAQSAAFDVAHPTYYRLTTRQELSAYRCPVVVTVWDLIDELFPQRADPRGVAAEMKRKAIQSASVIICISHNTKKDLLEHYKVPESKVRVTHLASEIHVGLSLCDERVPSRPYYLYVGSRSGYKNFGALLAAFRKAVSSRKEMRLWIVGPPFTRAEQRSISDLGLMTSIKHCGYATDERLAKIYSQSIALVYPSLYEGFGLPPLEAMSCGTAVLASGVSSIPEVVGDAGMLFDPLSIDELADKLLFLLDNPGKRERLVLQGLERAKSFSWDRTVAETLETYRLVSDKI